MRISDWSSDVCSSDLPTFLIPFCTWLLMGYFRSIPYELEECALIDGATRWQILVKIILPLAVPGLISARPEEHTSELQSLMRISYAVFCLKKKKKIQKTKTQTLTTT